MSPPGGMICDLGIRPGEEEKRASPARATARVAPTEKDEAGRPVGADALGGPMACVRHKVPALRLVSGLRR